ncbi:MAG: AzlC family ABC transporter permease [Anaerolineaceae bacterium]|nr:AzlC family ABC transporter permease [Anaerolineaceae bacterium]
MSNTKLPGLFFSGFKAASPIIVGYVPIGFAFGVLSASTGLSWFEAALMSLIVFAGSAQFIALDLLASASSPIVIITMTFIVNLRHMLFSAALSEHVKEWKPAQIAWFAYEITDESFAVQIDRFQRGEKHKGISFMVHGFAHISWIIGTILGVSAGSLLEKVAWIPFDFALPAMFISLLAGQIKHSKHLMIAIICGALSIILYQIGLSPWHVLIATVIGASIGLGMETCTKTTC